MAKKIDPRLIEILTEYGEDPKEALWDCHGTWVAYHKAIERIAAKAGVTFDMPQIIEANSASKVVAIAVRGTMGDSSEWSFGEAAPNNNKNAYPYAMSEKRAKDRVVLKLIGLHGLVYSEEEADDFKRQPDAVKREEFLDDLQPTSGPPRKENGRPEKGWREDGTRTSYALKKEQPDLWEQFETELSECQTQVGLEKFKNEWREKISKERWNTSFKNAAKDRIERREDEIITEMERLALASPDELAELPAKTALEHSLNQNPLMAGE